MLIVVKIDYNCIPLPWKFKFKSRKLLIVNDLDIVLLVPVSYHYTTSVSYLTTTNTKSPKSRKKSILDIQSRTIIEYNANTIGYGYQTNSILPMTIT